MIFADVIDISTCIIESAKKIFMHFYGSDAKLFAFVYKGKQLGALDCDLRIKYDLNRYMSKIDIISFTREEIVLGLSYLINNNKLLDILEDNISHVAIVLLLPVSESVKDDIRKILLSKSDFTDSINYISECNVGKKVLFSSGYVVTSRSSATISTGLR